MQATRAMRRHRHMIFLIGRGRDRIDARRIGALLVLADQRRGRDLRDHEARIEPGLGRQKSGKARQRRIDEHRDAAFGNRPDLADRKRDHVGGEGDWLGVKIAARQRFVGVGEDQRIVGNAVRFDLQRRARLAQDVERGAHHLRLAAQAIGVLNAGVILEVAGADRRPRHPGAQRARNLDLPTMAAQVVNTRIEGRVRTLGGFGRQRAGDERRLEQQFGLEQSGERIGGRKLRAVQQREPFLGGELDRREACTRKRLGGGKALVADEDFAHADHRHRHMRQWREVAAGADRALRGDHRGQAVDEHRFQQSHGFGPHARGALCKAGEFQRHHQPDDRDWRRIANPRRVAEHDIALKRCEVGVVDANAGELSKAGVDAIDRLTAREDAADRSGAFGDTRRRCRIEPGDRAAINGAPVGKRCGAGNKQNVGHRPLQIRAWSGLNPMR